MQEKQAFGERLKSERVRLGLTQPQLAALGKVSKASQNAYESAQTSPDAGYLVLIQAAGVDLQLLFTGVPTKLVAGQQLDWALVGDLLQVLRQFERTSGTEISAETSAQLLRILYSCCAPLNKIDHDLVNALLAKAA